MTFIQEILQKSHLLIGLVLSDGKNAEFDKIKLRLVKGKSDYFQAEKFKGDKVFHQNIESEQIEIFLNEALTIYRQACATLAGETIQAVFYGKKPKIKRTANSLNVVEQSHNRKKNYIFEEGESVAPLFDLGIFTKEGKIAKDKYDKFKQINRFIEIVDEAIEGDDKFTIADFGCGKSYLTFLLYHYLTVKRGASVDVIGYDLKADVVQKCNETAKKYGYENLSFYCGDVAKESIKPGTDMMVTLHACDTATDYAIATAIKSGVKYLFSVPCCQHEINLCIKKGGDYDILMRHGLIKERFCALLTDAIRAEVLEDFGYKTEIIEFVDFEHSPKNLMIRAVKTGNPTPDKKEKLLALCRQYSISQTLLNLVYGK